MKGWWKRGKHPIVKADSQLGRTGVFKPLGPFNSTPLTAGCLQWHNTYPDTQTHTSAEHENTSTEWNEREMKLPLPHLIAQFYPYCLPLVPWNKVTRHSGGNLPLRNGTPLQERNTWSIASDGFHGKQARHVSARAVQHDFMHLQMMLLTQTLRCLVFQHVWDLCVETEQRNTTLHSMGWCYKPKHDVVMFPSV